MKALKNGQCLELYLAEEKEWLVLNEEIVRKKSMSLEKMLTTIQPIKRERYKEDYYDIYYAFVQRTSGQRIQRRPIINDMSLSGLSQHNNNIETFELTTTQQPTSF
eukprot:CAMPEP_0117425706 /NCGR_PEP_ID=MMETSP0758-20121206/5956_1 /TAXON_ID=63605 /ORGANISM="Percolomonas cosmopolitus, Strain AE-1 (ATCC 50343)" /LENGTH=105 /DNA_ID=CAMNT_0005210415 /DNA_START=128 /DNA_END=442 /DNA_ORIENTATION=+